MVKWSACSRVALRWPKKSQAPCLLESNNYSDYCWRSNGGMWASCGLSRDELDVLFYLLSKRCLSDKHSLRYDVIEDALGSKMDVKAVLGELSLKQYVGCKKKKASNYWARAGKTISALESHGYSIPRGGKIRLS